MSDWINHVKRYASDNNVSYREALKLSRDSYHEMKGGSVKSGYIRRLIAEKPEKFDVSKIKKPSKNLVERFKKKRNDEDYDEVSAEVQKLLYVTSLEDIKKVLNDLKYRGRLTNNKMMLVLQVLQQFKTLEDIIKLRDELEEINKK